MRKVTLNFNGSGIVFNRMNPNRIHIRGSWQILLPTSPLYDEGGDRIEYVLYQTRIHFNNCRLIYADGSSCEFVLNEESLSYGGPAQGEIGDIISDLNDGWSSFGYVWRTKYDLGEYHISKSSDPRGNNYIPRTLRSVYGRVRPYRFKKLVRKYFKYICEL